MELYNRIRQRREELHMTQDELAQAMGYKSRSSINKIELGKSDIPQSKIKSFAEVLKTTPEYLMGLEELDLRNPKTILELMTIPNISHITGLTAEDFINFFNSLLENNTDRSYRLMQYIPKLNQLTDDQQNIIYGMIDNMVPPKRDDVNISLLAAHEDDNSSETDRQNDIEILKKHIKNNEQ